MSERTLRQANACIVNLARHLQTAADQLAMLSMLTWDETVPRSQWEVDQLKVTGTDRWRNLTQASSVNPASLQSINQSINHTNSTVNNWLNSL